MHFNAHFHPCASCLGESVCRYLVIFAQKRVNGLDGFSAAAAAAVYGLLSPATLCNEKNVCPIYVIFFMHLFLA